MLLEASSSKEFCYNIVGLLDQKFCYNIVGLLDQ